MDIQKIWHSTIQRLISVTNSNMKKNLFMLLEDSCIPKIVDNKLIVLCNSRNTLNSLVESGLEIISEIVLELAEQSFQLEFMVYDSDEQTFKTYDIALLDKTDLSKTANYEYSHVNPNKTFENFIADPLNQDLIELLKNAVTYSESVRFNPICIYGETGCGKTHLLWSVANRIKFRQKHIKVLYFRAYDLLAQYVQRVSDKNQSSLIATFNNSSLKVVILVDDVDSVVTSKKSSESFSVVINSLFYRSDALMIFASEKKSTFSKLRLYFPNAKCYELKSPQKQTKDKIIEAKCMEFGVELSEPEIGIIADKVSSDVRQIESIIKNLKLLLEEGDAPSNFLNY